VVRLEGVARHLTYALVVSCLLGRFCWAAEITVRVINARDGHEVKDLPIWVYPVEEKPKGKPLTATTGLDGTAVFHLPDPLPKSVFVEQEVSGKIGGCSSAIFSTREIMERGVVGDTKYRSCDPKGKLKGKFTARPGEIIIFVRFLRWWERMQT
jgi:hypothetical protein